VHQLFNNRVQFFPSLFAGTAVWLLAVRCVTERGGVSMCTSTRALKYLSWVKKKFFHHKQDHKDCLVGTTAQNSCSLERARPVRTSGGEYWGHWFGWSLRHCCVSTLRGSGRGVHLQGKRLRSGHGRLPGEYKHAVPSKKERLSVVYATTGQGN